MRKKIRVIAFVPMLIMMMVIWGFSSNNGEKSSEQSMGVVGRVILFVENLTNTSLTEEERQVWEERIHTPIRKMAHMTEYLIFALTTTIPFLLYGKSKKWISIFGILFCIGYACIDETHQLFVPERSGKITDVLVDSIGILFGVMLFRLLYSVYNKQKRCNSSALS